MLQLCNLIKVTQLIYSLNLSVLLWDLLLLRVIIYLINGAHFDLLVKITIKFVIN